MRSIKKTVSLLLAALLLLAMPLGASAADEKAAAGTYQMVVEGFDWGPGVTKLIIALNESIAPGSVDAAEFSVTVTKQALDWTTFQPTVADEVRPVTAAYVSDAEGNRMSDASAYVTLELAVSPDMGNPFYFFIDFTTGAMGNLWANPYTHAIEYTGKAIKNFAVDPEPAGKIMPLTDDFDMTGTFTASDGIQLTYASYTPPAKNEKRPLLIWLHGAGEGSVNGQTDPSAVLLGNRVTKLADIAIQVLMDGAYVLTPQSPTMWMDNGAGYTQNGDTIYVQALAELISEYVDNNPNIDTERVYIGGCSNGGFMTMKMLLAYPDAFAGAYPICEAYKDEWITDEQIESIKDIPIWFTQSKNDETVKYDEHALATYDRLIAAGAEDVHLSLFDTVLDTSGLYKDAEGNPYSYTGHWSWIYTLNNECVKEIDGNTVSLFAWLATKVKDTSSKAVASSPASSNSSTATAILYTVTEGDCLWKIGRAFGVEYMDIAALNNIANPNLILVGQQLQIPAK